MVSEIHLEMVQLISNYMKDSLVKHSIFNSISAREIDYIFGILHAHYCFIIAENHFTKLVWAWRWRYWLFPVFILLVCAIKIGLYVCVTFAWYKIKYGNEFSLLENRNVHRKTNWKTIWDINYKSAVIFISTYKYEFPWCFTILYISILCGYKHGCLY